MSLNFREIIPIRKLDNSYTLTINKNYSYKLFKWTKIIKISVFLIKKTGLRSIYPNTLKGRDMGEYIMVNCRSFRYMAFSSSL